MAPSNIYIVMGRMKKVRLLSFHRHLKWGGSKWAQYWEEKMANLFLEKYFLNTENTLNIYVTPPKSFLIQNISSNKPQKS